MRNLGIIVNINTICGFWYLVILLIRKPCSENKKKEITGSGIFMFNGEDASESGSANPASNNKTGIRMYQVLIIILQI